MTSAFLVPATWLALLAGSVAAAASYPPIPDDLTTPVQQRIAVNGPDAVSVAWNTYMQLSRPCVSYGLSADALTSQACSSSSVTYPTSRTWANSVTLTALSPATTYYYGIVTTNGSVGGSSANAVIDLGVYGADGYTIGMDMTKRDTIPTVEPALNHTTIGRLAQTVDDYEMVIHPGDLAYADDWMLKIKDVLDGADAYQAILEQFYDQLAPIAGRKAYMTSPGNHEAGCVEVAHTTMLCPDGQTNFTDFMTRFGSSLPTAYASTSANASARVAANRAAQLARPPFWYSFEYGMAHVTMVDMETDFAGAPDERGGSAGLRGGPFGATAAQQLDFLEADLASVDRHVTPWLVVAAHRPWYSVTGADDGDGDGGVACAACQAAFEPLLWRHGVDLVVAGHVHNSQRFLPVYNGTADPRGMQDPRAPMYIIAGGAGNIEGLSAIDGNVSFNAFAYADDFAYATLGFMDENNLKVEFIRSATGEVLDSSVLYKSHQEAFVVR